MGGMMLVGMSVRMLLPSCTVLTQPGLLACSSSLPFFSQLLD